VTDRPQRRSTVAFQISTSRMVSAVSCTDQVRGLAVRQKVSTTAGCGGSENMAQPP
jgi:hypothetical protein